MEDDKIQELPTVFESRTLRAEFYGDWQRFGPPQIRDYAVENSVKAPAIESRIDWSRISDFGPELWHRYRKVSPP